VTRLGGCLASWGRTLAWNLTDLASLAHLMFYRDYVHTYVIKRFQNIAKKYLLAGAAFTKLQCAVDGELKMIQLHYRNNLIGQIIHTLALESYYYLLCIRYRRNKS